jgi:hypothetical protein
MSFSWLANLELYAAVNQINFQRFYYCGTWCKFVPVSVLSNSRQIVISDMGFSSRTNSAAMGTETNVNTLSSCHSPLLLRSVVVRGACVWFGLWFSYHRAKLSLEELFPFALHHGLPNGFNK